MTTIQDRGPADACRGGIFPASKAMVHTHKIWKTVLIGTSLHIDDLKLKFASSGYYMGEEPRSVIEQEAFTLTAIEMELDLVKSSARDLGLTSGGYYSVICSAALGQGLWCSPAPDIGPELRLQYIDQPDNEILHVPTINGVVDAYSRLRLWVVMKRFGISYLHTVSGYPNVHFGPDELFVFVRPPKV